MKLKEFILEHLNYNYLGGSILNNEGEPFLIDAIELNVDSWDDDIDVVFRSRDNVDIIKEIREWVLSTNYALELPQNYQHANNPIIRQAYVCGLNDDMPKIINPTTL